MYFDPYVNAFPLNWALANWLITVGSMILVVLIVSLLHLVMTRGSTGFRVFASEIRSILSDLFSLSPRRVWALTRLTFMEAYRRKALAVFVVFALVFMFASWFMGSSERITADQVKVYISFVLTAISWLTI